jgi:hypothetical protein
MFPRSATFTSKHLRPSCAGLTALFCLVQSFIDITWRLRSKQLSIDVASTAQMLCGVETQLHMCVAGLTNTQLVEILQTVRKGERFAPLCCLLACARCDAPHYSKPSDQFCADTPFSVA